MKLLMPALMALLYSASASHIKEETALESQTEAVALSQATQDATLKAAVIKARTTNMKNRLAKDIAAYKAVYQAASKKLWDVYQAAYKAHYAKVEPGIKALPAGEQKAAWAKEQPTFAALKAKYDTDMKPVNAVYYKAQKDATARHNKEAAAIQAAQKDTKEKYTVQKKAAHTCAGSYDRLINDNSAHLWDLGMAAPGKFSDKSFPADRDQLMWKEMQHQQVAFKNEYATWALSFKRVRTMNKVKNGSIWGNKGISPAGITQGNLGNCWWVALVAGLAENPQRIKKIFRHFDVDKGIYEFQMFTQGRPIKVTIDDQLVQKKAGGFIFAEKSKNEAWWVPLLEKASAKYFNSYLNMFGGHAQLAYEQLTGYPSKFYYHKKMTKAAILKLISESDDANHIMQTGPSKKEKGLQTMHAYTLLRHMKWDGKDFIQLRNPWAYQEWTGAWSDFDKTIDAKKLAAFRAHVKKTYGHTSVDDGKFWISFTDFLVYFNTRTWVGYYLDTYKQTFINSNIAHKEFKNEWGDMQKVMHNFTLTNPVDQTVYLKMNQFLDQQFMDTKCYDRRKQITEGTNQAQRTLQMRVLEDATKDKWTPFKWLGDMFYWKTLKKGKYEIELDPEITGYRSKIDKTPINLQVFSSLQAVSIIEY